jgi:hypothetical protein
MKLNRKSQAWTTADSSTKDDDLFVCQHNAKPNVTSRISSDNDFDKYEIKSWHITMYQTVVVLNFLVLLTLLILELTVPTKSLKRQSKTQTSTNK